MKKFTAEGLLLFVNDMHTYEAFLEYVRERIDACHYDLERACGSDVIGLQGKIQELRVMLQMRELVHAAGKK